MQNLQETCSVLTLSQETGLERIAWSVDGQLFGVCTKGGSLNVYVSHMVSLTSVCAPRIAVLSSLNEISLYSYSADKVIISFSIWKISNMDYLIVVSVESDTGNSSYRAEFYCGGSVSHCSWYEQQNLVL